ncbi:MAG TPA: FAD-binding oxidoreductase [Arsenicitalea sp.]|nr:FAD-binding oxidoreductase [Arsenicitalea sp.]
MTDVIVLGAGIIGVCVAIHLQRRGRNVLLVDSNAPGRGTSFGNAGLIQREGVRPHTFPREFQTLLRIALKGGLDARYALSALPGYAPLLAQYWWHSAPSRYRQIVADYAPLISHSLSEHADLVAAAGAESLIHKDGWTLLFRSEESRDRTYADADRDARDYGVEHLKLDAAELARAEPDLRIRAAGGLRWTAPWSVQDPGLLVEAYAALFNQAGGTVTVGDARTLRQSGSGWTVETAAGPVTAAEAVVALGPWSADVTRELGYHLPLFVKRGYHREYSAVPGVMLNRPILDVEIGYLLAPMQRGIRLTTGAEFDRRDAPKNETQLEGTEAAARQLFELGDRLDKTPWMGARPCTPDMKPIIGPAPDHANLWFAFGHAHHGLTLGPVTGRLLAELMLGETPFVNAAPFSAARFRGGRTRGVR